MAQTALTVQDVDAPFAAVSANSLDFTFAAGDASNGNSFACTGRELLLVLNSDASNAYTFTVSSVDDEKGRAEDITTYSLAAGEYASVGVGLTNSKGWKQTSGVIYLAVSNAAIKFAVLRLPAGYPGG